MSFADRYRCAGLAHNPFAARSDGSISHGAFLDRGIPDPPPPRSRTLVQVIGESGAGKSTHLAHWRTRTPGPLHYIPRAPYRHRWATPPDAVAGLCYGDEIDRMPAPLRRRWFDRIAAAGSTLVIGTHIDLAPLGRRVGFSEVATHVLAPLTEAELGGLLARRLGTVALRDDHVQFSAAEVSEIHAESSGRPGIADVIAHRVLAEKVATLT